jgi:hypothetical protein
VTLGFGLGSHLWPISQVRGRAQALHLEPQKNLIWTGVLRDRNFFISFFEFPKLANCEEMQGFYERGPTFVQASAYAGLWRDKMRNAECFYGSEVDRTYSADRSLDWRILLNGPQIGFAVVCAWAIADIVARD